VANVERFKSSQKIGTQPTFPICVAMVSLQVAIERFPENLKTDRFQEEPCEFTAGEFRTRFQGNADVKNLILMFVDQALARKYAGKYGVEIVSRRGKMRNTAGVVVNCDPPFADGAFPATAQHAALDAMDLNVKPEWIRSLFELAALP
jgi:hypothetical protein